LKKRRKEVGKEGGRKRNEKKESGGVCATTWGNGFLALRGKGL